MERLDGDTIRDIFPNTGFSRADRDAHIKRVGYLASKLEKNGVFVVASFVSPYRESRDFVRTLCKNFVEVHVATPLTVCEQRDVKGLYAKARRGEIKNFTGIDDPFEPPLHPDLVVDTTKLTVDKAGELVVGFLRERNGKANSESPRPTVPIQLVVHRRNHARDVEVGAEKRTDAPSHRFGIRENVRVCHVDCRKSTVVGQEIFDFAKVHFEELLKRIITCCAARLAALREHLAL